MDPETEDRGRHLIGEKLPVKVSPEVYEKLKGWIERGDLVVVFQNHAMDSATLGRLLFMPIDKADREKVVLGRTKAPDDSTFKMGLGAGWKFLAVLLTDNLRDFEVDAAPLLR